MTKTEEAIHSMLKENTGRALCDSGGTPKYDNDGNYIGSKHGYGRNYEKHKNKTVEDFKESPDCRLKVWDGEDFYIVVDVFHWMVNRLEFREKLTELLYGDFVEESLDGKRGHLAKIGYLEAFPHFAEHKGLHRDVTGLHGEGDPMVVNTYNGECSLSQTLQFVYYEAEYESFVVMQTHNGADVRGGYSYPKVFMTDTDVLRWNLLDLGCEENRNHIWTTDAGYHFWEDGSTAGKNLKEFNSAPKEEWDKLQADEECELQKELFDEEDYDNKEGKIQERDLLVYDRDEDTLFCPYCKPPFELKPQWF